MIKVIVIENFTLGRFNELKKIKRANVIKNQEGHLYVNDTFECTEEMYNYLTEGNKEKRAFVKLIEVIPDEDINKQDVEKPKTRTRKRKTIAKN